MAERNFFQKLIKPTLEEKAEFLRKKERSDRIIDLLEEKGLFKTQQILKEQEALDEGVPEEEVNKMASDFDNKAVMPKIEKFIKSPIDSTVETVKGVFKEPEVEETPRDPGLPPEEDNEVSVTDSIGAAINSGLIKIPKGVINFGTLVYDALQEEGIPVEQSATFKFNKAFEDSFLGVIEKESEEKARETAQELIGLFQDRLRYYSIFDNSYIPIIFSDIENNLNMYRSIVGDVVKFDDKAYGEEVQNEFINHIQLFEQLLAE